jgi:hypothetical protein
MAGLTLLQSTAVDIPTPASGKVTIFFNTATGLPSYKDDAGVVHSMVGATGSTGSQGPAGVAGATGDDASSYFPGGWR